MQLLYAKKCISAMVAVALMVWGASVIMASDVMAKDEGRELVLPPPVPPAPRPTVPQALEQGLPTLPPVAPQPIPDPGVSFGNVGGTPVPGQENMTPINPNQVPMPSGPGATATVPIPESAPTRGSEPGGFNSSPFGHPWFRDAHGPI
jgi:hypothetical protein